MYWEEKKTKSVPPVVLDNRAGTEKTPRVLKITLIKPFLLLLPNAVAQLLSVTMCETNDFTVLLVQGGHHTPPRLRLFLWKWDHLVRGEISRVDGMTEGFFLCEV